MKDFDELLDEVLREDGQAMSRPGLETRVMARLRSDERPAWRWWIAGVMAAAACAVAGMVWVAPRDVRGPKHTVIVAEKSSQRELGGSGRALRDAHLRRDESAPKMGHPVVAERKARRSLIVAQRKRLPKLETFPAVTQKGEAASWLGEGGDSKLVAAAKEMSPLAVKAYQELREAQDQPLNIVAIEIKPLQ